MPGASCDVLFCSCCRSLSLVVCDDAFVSAAAPAVEIDVAVGLTFTCDMFHGRPGERKDALAVDRYQLRWICE